MLELEVCQSMSTVSAGDADTNRATESKHQQ